MNYFRFNTKTVLLALLIVVISLGVNIIYVYNNPDLMVEDMVLASMQQLPWISCLVSAVLFVLFALVLKIQWRFMIPTMLLSALLTLVGVIVIAKTPGSSDAFLTMYRAREQAPNNSNILQIGKVPPDILTAIQSGGVDVYLIDGTESQQGLYWLILLDQTHGNQDYDFTFFDSANSIVEPPVSLTDLWTAVRQNENLPSSSKYTEVSGIPTAKSRDFQAELDSFSRQRTIHFRTAQGQEYSVRLYADEGYVKWTVSKG